MEVCLMLNAPLIMSILHSLSVFSCRVFLKLRHVSNANAFSLNAIVDVRLRRRRRRRRRRRHEMTF